MAVITLKVNEHEITAHDDQTVLMAAREAGIAIPTLCHLDGLTDVGACRLCLVEIGGTSRLQAACVTRVTEGMRVETETPKLREYRKMILELLFAERNHVCAVCVANTKCELQDMAVSQGMDHVRYDYRYPEHRVDYTHERFAMDHNRCILCTRCVRVCDEVEGAHTRDVAGRGVNSWIITDLNQPWGTSTTCTSCGKCVMACPTGALFEKGRTVAALDRDRPRLERLITARERNEWNA